MAGEPEDMVWTEEKASSILAALHADPGKKEGLLNLLASSTNLVGPQGCAPALGYQPAPS